MKVLVLGGDGFCGGPTSLHLSALGHELVVVDDLGRRAIDLHVRPAHRAEPATIPCASVGTRAQRTGGPRRALERA